MYRTQTLSRLVNTKAQSRGVVKRTVLVALARTPSTTNKGSHIFRQKWMYWRYEAIADHNSAARIAFGPAAGPVRGGVYCWNRLTLARVSAASEELLGEYPTAAHSILLKRQNECEESFLAWPRYEVRQWTCMVTDLRCMSCPMITCAC